MVDQPVKPSSTPAEKSSAPVAPKPAPGSAGKPPLGTPAAKSVAAFGGNRGGKHRKDGLTPGSPEAEAADKKNDRERKRQSREAAAIVAEPAALPSMVAPGPGPGPASLPGVPGSDGAALSPPGNPLETIVPWESGTLRPLFEQVIEGAEEARVENRRVKASSAGLPEKIVKEIVSDARYPATAKRALVLSGPNATARLLNEFGISGKYSDAAIAGTALVAILIQSRRSDAKFNELIAEFKKTQAASGTPEVKK